MSHSPAITSAMLHDAAVVTFNVEHLLALASQHAEDAGPEVEVGDLQDLTRACWQSMSTPQREHFLQGQAVSNAVELDLLQGRPGSDDAGLSWILQSAQAHGQADDPDHEVGDLQDAVRGMWACMSTSGHRAVLANDAVGTLVELGGAPGPLYVPSADSEDWLPEDEWTAVAKHFGLDDSFQYSQQQRADYGNAFLMWAGVRDEQTHATHPAKRQQPRERAAAVAPTNTIGEGQHRISYAYPTSPSACRHGRGADGTYVVATAAGETPVPDYAAALENIQRLGTVPNRWSMDHPENARFLPRAS